MCYYTLYLFLACGHCVPSYRRLGHSPPCSAARSTRHASLFSTPSLASPIALVASGVPWASAAAAARGTEREDFEADADGDAPGLTAAEAEAEGEGAAEVCTKKLSHPLHTYRVAGSCLRCVREREERLARFEIGGIRDEVEREGGLGRWQKQRRNQNEEERLKVKVASPGLRSGYVEGRRSGMILERNGRGELVDRGSEEVEVEAEVDRERDEGPKGEANAEVVAEALRWDPEMGAFEGRRSGSGSGSWARAERA